MKLRLFRVGDESIVTVNFPVDLYDRCFFLLTELLTLFPRLLFPVGRFSALAVVEPLAAAAAGGAAAFFFFFCAVLFVFRSLGFLFKALDV
jgi:hypothetical protein